MPPVVAIIGRPNVGKSTLLNRIVGRREAIVEERPGVTRDRKAVEAEWQGREFTLIDTGGWLAAGTELDGKVSRQSEKAMAEADAVLFVVDSRIGMIEEDARAAEVVRRLGKPTFVVVNKVDHVSREIDAWEFVSLGLGDPWPVSALHGLGTGDLLDALVAVLPEPEADEAAEAAADADEDDDVAASGGDAAGNRDDELFSVAIVGRPNVGKSTLFNRLIGDERSVVHDMPGTTRDAIDTIVQTDFGPVRFVDTAGMRRRAKIDKTDEEQRTEFYSMMRALKAVDGADVALLVIDATSGVTHQDQRLAERVDGAGCPVVILLNKWELLDAEQKEDVALQCADRLRFLEHSPTLKISALSGRGVQKLLPSLGAAISDYHTRVPTATVNKVIREAQLAQAAPAGARVLYATQGAADPPTFTLFTNRDLPATYLRYLERKLREGCSLGSTPIKLRVRRRS